MKCGVITKIIPDNEVVGSWDSWVLTPEDAVEMRLYLQALRVLNRSIDYRQGWTDEVLREVGM